MNRIRILHSGIAALAVVAAAGIAPASAQTEIVAAPNPDADALQTQIRVLAESPRDVDALLAAGQLSTKLGDTSAALAFFQRAEAAEPGNPRILSGRASALVRLERPGEALRLFQEAEAKGVSPREYASDRGFAYDLLGSPDLAQRDYKLALSQRRDDETIRRYALSLGISGDGDEAMRQLDTLLRGGDRASWRARAFILAMNGDGAGAERIAARMMPGNMGESLTPFFRRLAYLSPADRAFAVHFGEMSPTQARLADARLAPPLPRYVPKSRPVQVAQAQPVAASTPAAKSNDRRSRRDRGNAAPPATFTPAPAPIQTAAAEPPLPSPPAYVERPAPMVQPLPTTPEPNWTPPPSRPVQLASRETVQPTPRAEAPVTRAATIVSLPAAQPERPAVVDAPRPAPAPARRVGAEDAALAAIVAGITIPPEEVEAANRVVVPAPEPIRAEEPAKPAPKPAAPKPKPEPVKVEAPKLTAKGKPEPKDDPKAAKGKADTAKADPKSAKGKADLAKADAKGKKSDPKKPDPAKADPARIWVQVAGGANEASLPKAWKAVVAKAPAAFKGRAGWSTPLRATNRVLTGPFKTNAEAQAFVNSLGKTGVSGFVFTSEAGQKVTKLGAQ